MNKAFFDSLTQEAKLSRVEAAIQVATPQAVFGDEKQAKTNYRSLMRSFHPDGYPASEQPIATRITAYINRLWSNAEKLITDGTYSVAIDAGITADINGNEYVLTLMSPGIIETYSAVNTMTDEHFVIRLATETSVNDLLANEASVLQYLSTGANEEQFNQRGAAYIPRYLESFTASGLTGLILKYESDGKSPPSELISLQALADYTLNKVDPRLIGWLWRRLLFALTFIHDRGVISASITPSDIWIDPSDTAHSMILGNWCHATIGRVPVSSLSSSWASLYPKEVYTKTAPHRSLDTYMAASSMLWATSGNVNPAMESYFRSMLKGTPLSRPSHTEVLLHNWDTLMYATLKWKREFVAVGVNAQTIRQIVDWSWFWA